MSDELICNTSTAHESDVETDDSSTPLSPGQKSNGSM